MPQSRNRKKTKQKNQRKNLRPNPKPYEVIKQNLYKFDNPFPKEIPQEERIKIFLEISKTASEKFEENYLELIQFFDEYDSLYLLSFSVYYFLAHEEGVDQEAIEGKLDFPPFFIEILQAQILRQNQTVEAKPLHQNASKFRELLRELNDNQQYRYFNLIKDSTVNRDLHAVSLRMNMMIQTLAVRNWAYEYQMKEVAYDLAKLVNDSFKKHFDFDLKELLDTIFGLLELTNDKLNEHRKKVSLFMKANNYNELFDKYEQSFPKVNQTNAEIRLAAWDRANHNLKSIKFMMMAHSDLFLSDIFTFELNEIKGVAQTHITDENLKIIFDHLSYEFGDLKELNKDHIFLDNPIHLKPFIKLDNKIYFSAITWLFYHLGVDLLESFINIDSIIRNQYLKEKGKYLETRIEKLFREAFPTASIYTGSLWQASESGKEFENDLLVLIEDFAIIVEAKSGGITPPAKRGAPNRLFETLEELIVEAAEQAIRFQSFLKENKRIHTFKNKKGDTNIVDSTKIKYYVPLGVTLSNLGSIGCNLKKIVDAGIVNISLDNLAPSISMTDLEIIFRLLPLQAQKIHYLSRRREFEAHVIFEGDEMDLFAFYLDNMFNIGEEEYKRKLHFQLTLKSKELDPYIIGTSRGITVAKPAAKMTKFWFDLLNKLVERKSKMWLHASYILLNAPEDDQKKFELELGHLKKRILNKTAPNKHNWMVFYCGPERRKYLIVGYPYTGIDKQTRNKILTGIMGEHEDDEIRGILIIGQNLDDSYYPYSVIAGTYETNFLDFMELN